MFSGTSAVAGGPGWLELAADNGLTIFAYTADPGSRHEEALKLVGSWAATPTPSAAPGPA